VRADRGRALSTALVTALRESGGYLRDDGYEQTAQLMATAADEIERLNRRVHALETDSQTPTASRRAVDHLRRFVQINAAQAGPAGLDPQRHRK
jgi:hypothetical protein